MIIEPQDNESGSLINDSPFVRRQRGRTICSALRPGHQYLPVYSFATREVKPPSVPEPMK
jgi:hypothetical protein